ncbi:helix-turn-helix transcriptional regulator [Alteromonas sp. NFXS44]|uniref:helix-turn-helix domain-containing protein n=1 Tax=Alteromonas sp. NFXS44 TaxID=2818435 RepID=UPI0032DF9BF1
MQQIKQLIGTLKRCLKQRGFTYKSLAERLDLSEASMKRCFAQEAFTLERLAQICDVMDLTLSELFQLSEREQPALSQLTEEQEKELLANPKLLLMAVLVRDGWQFDDITGHYAIDPLEGVRLLAKLDKLRLIELLPGNRYRLRIGQNFRWIPGGPLAQFMEQEVMVKFMAPKRGEPWLFRLYIRGRYSEESIRIIEKRLKQLSTEAAELNDADSSLPVSERTHIGMLLAVRPWEPSLFEKMRREQSEAQQQ